LNSTPFPYRPRILICPLDWGLGHATRCIPIIKELDNLGCEVIIAADKLTFSLLKKEFPSLQFISLGGYHIKYSHNKKWLPFKIMSQVPKLLRRIKMETKWLKKTIVQYQIDGIISDNRFGLYSTKVPCIYITHQLAIQTGTIIGDFLAQKLHYYFIKKYQECWVPDFTNEGLAGKLSHPKKVPENVSYIGALSRFEKSPDIGKIYDVLVLISGPEPQRSIFEKMILSSVIDLPGKTFIVRGLPSATEEIAAPNDFIKIKNHLDASSLNKVLQQSKLVISRSGYTTVMDLIKLGSKAILVPTPGQTEQEYLARYLLSKGYFYSVSQERFSLKKEINKAAKFAYKKPEGFKEIYKGNIEKWVLLLKDQSGKKTKL
jgi:uncharacterized protein (TIGR00661 family)